MNNYINIGDLVKGQCYYCDARNFDVGEWTGTHFEYLRTKWGSEFYCKEFHWDIGAPYGTVKPLKEIR